MTRKAQIAERKFGLRPVKRLPTVAWRLKTNLHWAVLRARLRGDEPPTITLPFLLKLWERQRERCYLTGLPLCTRARHPLMITLDRKNPKKPYTKRNTGIAARWANSAKGEFTAADFHCLVLGAAPFASRQRKLKARG
jgi:hypothetical protein